MCTAADVASGATAGHALLNGTLLEADFGRPCMVAQGSHRCNTAPSGPQLRESSLYCVLHPDCSTLQTLESQLSYKSYV